MFNNKGMYPNYRVYNNKVLYPNHRVLNIKGLYPNHRVFKNKRLHPNYRVFNKRNCSLITGYLTMGLSNYLKVHFPLTRFFCIGLASYRLVQYKKTSWCSNFKCLSDSNKFLLLNLLRLRRSLTKIDWGVIFTSPRYFF